MLNYGVLSETGTCVRNSIENFYSDTGKMMRKSYCMLPIAKSLSVTSPTS